MNNGGVTRKGKGVSEIKIKEIADIMVMYQLTI